MGTGRWFAGLDLGQSRDFRALAVLERAELKGKYDATMCAQRKKVALRLRYLERMPLARAGTAGNAVSGDRGAGEADDESAGTGWAAPPGGGPAAEGAAEGDAPSGDHHGRGGGEPEQGLLRGAEAGSDHGATGIAATRGVADRGGVEARSGAGGDAGEGGLRGADGRLTRAACLPCSFLEHVCQRLVLAPVSASLLGGQSKHRAGGVPGPSR